MVAAPQRNRGSRRSPSSMSGSSERSSRRTNAASSKRRRRRAQHDAATPTPAGALDDRRRLPRSALPTRRNALHRSTGGARDRASRHPHARQHQPDRPIGTFTRNTEPHQKRDRRRPPDHRADRRRDTGHPRPDRDRLPALAARRRCSRAPTALTASCTRRRRPWRRGHRQRNGRRRRTPPPPTRRRRLRARTSADPCGPADRRRPRAAAAGPRAPTRTTPAIHWSPVSSVCSPRCDARERHREDRVVDHDHRQREAQHARGRAHRRG